MAAEVLTGIALGLAVAVPLGPGTTEIIRRGLGRGFFEALTTGFGCLSADLLCIGLVYLGLASIIKITAVKIIVLLLGAIVLMSIGLKGIYTKSRIKSKKQIIASPYLSGFVMVGLSPFSLLFWTSAFGSLMSTITTPIFIVAGIIIGMLTWFTTLSGISTFAKKMFSKKFIRCITIAAGITIAGFGIRFLALGIVEIIKVI